MVDKKGTQSSEHSFVLPSQVKNKNLRIQAAILVKYTSRPISSLSNQMELEPMVDDVT